jgi:hypothetical protein
MVSKNIERSVILPALMMNMNWFRLVLFGFSVWFVTPPSASCQGVVHLYPVVEGDRLGFIDSSGQERIHPQFEGYACSFRTAPQFSEGLAPVNIGGKLGYVDETGKVVLRLPYFFVEPHPFREGIALVQIRTFSIGVPDVWVWIDRTGKILYTDTQNWRGEFHEGLMKFQTRQYWGYVDQSFQWVIPPRYQSAEDFSEGLALVSIATESKRDWAYIDKTGKMLFRGDAQYFAPSSFSDGLARINVVPTSGPKARQSWFEFVDYAGHEVIGPVLQGTTNYFSEGYAFACRDCSQRRMAIIDKQGNQLTPPEFETSSISEFHEGLAAIRNGAVYGYINPAGTWVVAPQFDEAFSFSNGLALVRWNARREWAYIDLQGKVVWKGADRCDYPMP